jgi:hypothetical protein
VGCVHDDCVTVKITAYRIEAVCAIVRSALTTDMLLLGSLLPRSG